MKPIPNEKMTIMKKFTILLASLLLSLTILPALAAGDRIITVGELPASSQHFIQAYFKDVEVSFARVDEEFFDKDYKVLFVNGAKVEFLKNGDWKEIDCKYGEVPAGIVPKPILDYVSSRFAGRKVVCIDRDRRGYDVELDGGLDLEFDRDFRLIDIDD